MTIDYSLVGKRVAEIRKQRKLTQEQLAEKANISSNYLSHIETSRSIPSLETLVDLCEALGTTPDQILLGTTHAKEDYMVSDIAQKLMQCTEYERRIVFHLLDTLLKERTKK